MDKSRRDLLTGIGGFALAASTAGTAGSTPLETPRAGGGAPSNLPHKADFDIEDGYTYINAAYTHPIPKVALAAAYDAAANRGRLRPMSDTEPRPDPKDLFAKLVGAQRDEIAYVPSTSYGENLVVQALGLNQRFDGNVVTDGLHFGACQWV